MTSSISTENKYKLFYWKSLKELLTRSFTTTISSLEEREEHVISHTPRSIFPLPPSKGYSILAAARQSWSSVLLCPTTLTDPMKNFKSKNRQIGEQRKQVSE